MSSKAGLVFALTCSMAIWCGCSAPDRKDHPCPIAHQTEAELARNLRALGRETDAWEARLLSETACRAAQDLATQYRAVRPPWLHNMLVNANLKERGLCYHWAEDLQARLSVLPVQTFEIHRAVARPGTPREHNALVITVRNRPLAEGIVLDPWRGAGQVFWCLASHDRYPWQSMPERSQDNSGVH